MKKYSLFSLIAALIMVGCTNTDSFFANNMIPPSQQMKTYIDSSLKVKTYQVTIDSSISNVSGGFVMLGSMIDKFVGRTTVGAVASYSSNRFAEDNGDVFFGTNPVADSMLLKFQYASLSNYGDTTQKIKITIYELLNYQLHPYQRYYTNFNPAPYYDASKPLASFVSNGFVADTVHFPRWFYSKFIQPEFNIPGESNPYRNDTIFHQYFNGFYIKAEPVTSGRGQIANLNLSASVSGMTLFYHNDNYKDSVQHMIYGFYSSDGGAPYNVAFQVSDHDYSYSDVAAGGVDPNVINQNIETKSVFVQGLGGLACKVVINMEEIERLKKEAKDKGFGHIGIHKAELRWLVREPTLTYYNESFSRLVLYSWINRKLNYIPDYDPEMESLYNIPAPIDGHLLRSVGYYSQDISSFVQRVFSGAVSDPTVVLTPDEANDRLPARSILGGSLSVDRTPYMILTYTLIK